MIHSSPLNPLFVQPAHKKIDRLIDKCIFSQTMNFFYLFSSNCQATCAYILEISSLVFIF